MFPFFFSLGWLGNWIDNLMKNQPTQLQSIGNLNKSEFVNQIDDKVMNELTGFLEVFEGYHDRAYDLRDGRITIGYGTTTWLKPNGSRIRDVRMGDVITREDARLQVIYFFNAIISSNRIYMGTNNLSIHKNVMVALLNFCYMGGTGFMNYDLTKRILKFANNNTDQNAVAENLKSNIINWLKSIKFKAGQSRCRSSAVYKYDCFGLGWSRRVYASMDLVKGIKRPKSYYDINMKKPF